MEQPTLIKATNQQLNDRIDKLEQEKAELQGLLANASHDLRSPLTNIQLSASLIEHYYERLDKDKVLGHMAKIKDEVSHFVAILNTYLLSEKVK